jgi:uncharacterized protein YecA (UPF0149 family)
VGLVLVIGGVGLVLIALVREIDDQAFERGFDGLEAQTLEGEATELRKEAKRGGVATRITKPKIGRNEPCPCGSGKKSLLSNLAS